MLVFRQFNGHNADSVADVSKKHGRLSPFPRRFSVVIPVTEQTELVLAAMCVQIVAYALTTLTIIDRMEACRPRG